MHDLVDIFYRDIKKLLDDYQNNIIQKDFVDKSGEIELIPINIAKGKQMATKQITSLITGLYNKYKKDLNNSSVE